MRLRVEKERTESDTALFNALMYWGEMVTKYAVSILLAGVQDDRDKHRIRITASLIRADGIGEWERALGEVLVGPASPHLCEELRREQKELTQKQAAGTWQYDAVSSIHECLKSIRAYKESLPDKIPGQRWFNLFTILRNKTRGHGALPPTPLSQMCPLLKDSLELISNNLSLFGRPVAYVRRNLSGKYRITPVCGDIGCFSVIRDRRSENLVDGMYVQLGACYRLELIESDPDTNDYFFPNGGFTQKRFSALSYLSGIAKDLDASAYQNISTDLPASETEGLGGLEVQEDCFGNVPPVPRGYISREDLEGELFDQLVEDRHPIITLHGRGGIGKTWLALRVLWRILTTSKYEAVIWFSARDIDLLPTGPKRVKPKVTTQHDIARDFVEFLNPVQEKDFMRERYLSEHMCSTPLGGPILFVFDNFETVRSPGDLFSWLDNHIRTPNKILITTRTREFKGDYPIEVVGMSDLESRNLIEGFAKRLGIKQSLNKKTVDRLIEESRGHPYVMRIMLGELAKRGRSEKVEHVFAGLEDVLEALFDRTYLRLSPAGQRVFLVLCSWRSAVPRLALEAVLLRHEDGMDVREAITELEQYALIEVTSGFEDEDEELISVPLIAAVFGRRKLRVSEVKSTVENDTELLRGFGPVQSSYRRLGIEPSIERAFANVARKVDGNPEGLSDHMPMLEALCRRYSKAWLHLSQLHEDLGNYRDAIKCAKKYIEVCDEDPEIRRAWMRLERLCEKSQDWSGSLQAVVEMCKLPDSSFQAISSAASKINKSLREHFSVFEIEEKSIIVSDMARLMEDHLKDATADDLSRLAWLYMNLKNRNRAMEIAHLGLKREPGNRHCKGIVERLSMRD